MEPKALERPTLVARMPQVSLNDQLLYYRKRVEELEIQESYEKKASEAELKEKIAEMGYTVTEKEGEEMEEYEDFKPWYVEAAEFIKELLSIHSVSSNKGLTIALISFAGLVLGFAWYPTFFPLNDSEQRIFNAATLHFISHVWMGIGVFLLGLGFQFLFFNNHFKYLWSNIDTRPSAQADFAKGDTQDLLRLSIALATFMVPVWIFTNMFQLILG